MDGSLDRVPDRVVAAIAAHGLPSRARLPARELDDAAFDQVLDAVRRHRVLGMLAAAVADGAFPVTDTQRERCAALEEEWAVLALELERLLLGVASVLERAGIVYRVFKGPALAHTVYPHAAWRMFADLDLVVPGGATFDAARDAIITGLGAVQSIPELRPGFDAEFGKDAPLKVGPMEVDLHRTFATGPIGLTIPLDELFGDAPSIVLGGRSLPTLTPTAAFLQACVNAAVGDLPVRACSLRDVVQLAPFVDDQVDVVVATARRWGIGMVVQRAVELAWQGLGLEPGPLTEWAASSRAPLRERLVLRAYLTPARSYTRPAASLLVIHGTRARARYLRALVLPQHDYLTSRGWDLGAHVSRALRTLREPFARRG